MTDVHVHIGQFNDKYYDSHAVFNAIEQAAENFGMTLAFTYAVQSFNSEEKLWKQKAT